MSAPNFYKTNASKYYVVDFEDSFEYEIFLDFLTESIEQQGFTRTNRTHHERSYPTTAIAEKTITKYYNDVAIEVCITLLIRSGYYAAANLDYELSVYVNGTSVEPDETGEFYVDYFEDDFGKGLVRMHRPHIENFVSQAITDLEQEAESIFAEHSQQYIKTAQFSNGEAFYEKI